MYLNWMLITLQCYGNQHEYSTFYIANTFYIVCVCMCVNSGHRLAFQNINFRICQIGLRIRALERLTGIQ